ncbi:hypothetical protein BJ944DRAFT_157022 [Cunninghamella echinulata]|nr:hypothetical protein BJ944DRAFT_157022 [Cunninghamella echinulata]
MAVEYPNATFVGIDIAINPDGTINDTDNIRLIPKNCQFQQIDILKEIILPPNSFDYIYQRFLYTVYSLNQVESKFKEFVGLLKPGGYMELVEYDLHPKQIGPKFTLIIKAYANVVTSQNKELYHGPHLKQCLTDAGLEDINGDYISIPICWGGNMGKILYELINEVLSQFGAILWPWLELEGEYDKDVYFEFVDSAFNECVEYKTYFNLHWATGRKPLNKAN